LCHLGRWLATTLAAMADCDRQRLSAPSSPGIASAGFAATYYQADSMRSSIRAALALLLARRLPPNPGDMPPG
jgi:hypothetical protein